MNINSLNNVDSKRGFTLIELLAVIVVLAVVMLIGVNAVLPQMDKARRNSFSIEVNGFVKSAQQQFVMSQLGSFVLSDGQTCCVDLTTLISKGQSDLKESDGYKGYILITNSGGNIIYKPYLTNTKFYVDDTKAEANKSYSSTDVKDGSVSGKATSCDTTIVGTDKPASKKCE